MYSNKFDNNYALSYSAAFIYVFHDKDRFNNSKKPTKGQELLCNGDIFTVENQREISSFLRIKVQISILILKKVAYVSNFLFKLISFICLKDKKYK